MTFQMNRFFIYKEYGVKYELMIKDLALAENALPALEVHQKGFEVLASSLGSESSRTEQTKKKASTIRDLLVKVSSWPLSTRSRASCGVSTFVNRGH